MSTMLKMTLPEGPACEIAHTYTADAVTCGSEAFRSVTQKHVLQAHRLDSVEAVSLPVLGGHPNGWDPWSSLSSRGSAPNFCLVCNCGVSMGLVAGIYGSVNSGCVSFLRHGTRRSSSTWHFGLGRCVP